MPSELPDPGELPARPAPEQAGEGKPAWPVAGELIPAKIVPPPSANLLTPDEQMARFAQELKENDWGHQPC